jgi:metal-responsive CopG/Arc/MetJ family transcriptional regulator
MTTVINRYYPMSYKVFSISLDPRTSGTLDERLAAQGMNRSEYIRSLIRADIAANPPKKPAKKGAAPHGR